MGSASIDRILYSKFKVTTADGCGYRFSVYFQGCPIRCPGCHNKGIWDIQEGVGISIETLITEIKHIKFLSGVSILGGEPFYQKEGLRNLVSEIRRQLPELTIWIYSGYTLEWLRDKNDVDYNYILTNIDVLVDGPYIESMYDETCIFKGSSNQRIIKNPGKECKIITDISELDS